MAAISAGEEPRSFDPAMSEWGNPAEFILSRRTAKTFRIVHMNSEILSNNIEIRNNI